MRYHDIKKEDMTNGDDIGVVLFVAGCDFRCKGCQNPLTHNHDGGLLFDEDAKKELFAELDRPEIHRITFSGGDPLSYGNRFEITELSKEIKEKYPNVKQWLYTGNVYEKIKDLEIFEYLEVLVDGQYIEEQMETNLRWKGSKNQRVINIPKTLSSDDDSIVIHCEVYDLFWLD